ncbi:MAG TPA: MarP family serine protease [Candidatus Saccharimonadia bacterium]|nr:MarP family serine protease [Candidatus Saccharimonadia bacterium]
MSIGTYFVAFAPFLSISGIIVAFGIDLLVVALVLVNVIHGRRLGFTRQVLADIGFFLGVFLGMQLVPIAVTMTANRLGRMAIAFGVVLGVGLFMGFAGDRLGLDLRRATPRLAGLHRGGAIMGAVLSGATSLILVWLVSGMVLTTSFGWFATGLQHSLMLRFLTRVAPPPPLGVTRLQSFIDPNGIPQVFVGLEPAPAKSVDTAEQALVDKVVALDGDSTVRVEGLGCGGLVSGGGFVAGPDEVLTAAHVVAGIKRPFAVDRTGIHAATVVAFDPGNDIALLRVEHVAGKPLRLAPDESAAGAKAVVLGYPDGGPFTGESAGILDRGVITGYDIYGRGRVERPMYSLEAAIRPGNSGGPVVLPDGSVAGMVLARSLYSNDVGYALTTKVVEPFLAMASGRTEAVGVGSCTTGD